jgi:hypothetical protein
MNWIFAYFVYRIATNNNRPAAPVEETAGGLIIGGFIVAIIFGLLAWPFLLFKDSLWLGVPLLVGAVVGLLVAARGISIAVHNHRDRGGTAIAKEHREGSPPSI